MDNKYIKYAVERFEIKDFEVTDEAFHYAPDVYRYSLNYNNRYQYQYETRTRPMVTLKLPLEQFERMLRRVDEFEELNRDSQTRELVDQARFIHRMKYGAI